MKVLVTIVGGVVLVLGLVTVLLSIYVAQLGTGSTGWDLPEAVGYPIEAFEALERSYRLHKWLFYVGLGNMFVGLDLMLAVPIVSALGMRRLKRSSGRRQPPLLPRSRSASSS